MEHKKGKREPSLTDMDYAIEQAECGICSACSAVGCNNQDWCDGYKEEIERVLKELKEEREDEFDLPERLAAEKIPSCGDKKPVDDSYRNCDS